MGKRPRITEAYYSTKSLSKKYPSSECKRGLYKIIENASCLLAPCPKHVQDWFIENMSSITCFERDFGEPILIEENIAASTDCRKYYKTQFAIRDLGDPDKLLSFFQQANTLINSNRENKKSNKTFHGELVSDIKNPHYVGNGKLSA